MKIIVKNRKAKYDFDLKDRFVAGISLLGSEVKSIKKGNVSLKDSFVVFKDKSAFLINMNVSEHHSYVKNHDPERNRQLLLQKGELKKIRQSIQLEHMTVVPIIIFLNEKGLIKIEIALAKGKKKYDKRRAEKEKQIKKEIKDL